MTKKGYLNYRPVSPEIRARLCQNNTFLKWALIKTKSNTETVNWTVSFYLHKIEMKKKWEEKREGEEEEKRKEERRREGGRKGEGRRGERREGEREEWRKGVREEGSRGKKK